MPLTFPINPADKFTIYDAVNSEILKDSQGRDKTGVSWPSEDLSQMPQGFDYPNLRFLLEVRPADPAFDPATHKLVIDAPVVDLNDETITHAKSAVALTQQELDDIADNTDRDAKLTATGNKVATLRAWATQAAGVTVTTGNVVDRLQDVYDNLAIFYDAFADLIEGQRIDKNNP